MDNCFCEENPSKRLLRSSGDLNRLRDLQAMPLNTLKLELPWLSVDENAALERKFNKHINACGCDIGGYFTIAGIVLAVILGSTEVLAFSWKGIGHAALICIGFGFIGKTIGLIGARIAFFRLLRKVCSTTPVNAV